MNVMPQEDSLKRIHSDTLAPGDEIVVPVVQDGEGRNVLEASHKRNDEYAEGRHSFRIPVQLNRKRMHLQTGDVWYGKVDSIVPTGRTVYRPGKKEVVEVRLKDMRTIDTIRKFLYFQYRNYVVEIENLYVNNVRVATLHRDFSTEGILDHCFVALPTLDFDGHNTIKRRLDWKEARVPMGTEEKARLFEQAMMMILYPEFESV